MSAGFTSQSSAIQELRVTAVVQFILSYNRQTLDQLMSLMDQL